MKLICAGAALCMALSLPATSGAVTSTVQDTASTTAAADTTVGDAAVPAMLPVGQDTTEGTLTVDEKERDALKKTLMQLGSAEVPGARQWQRKKIPKLAMLGSAVLPGLGQLYAGRRIKVGIVAGLFSTYMAGAWLHWKDAQAAIAYRSKFPADVSVRVLDFQNRLIEYHKESARDFLWWSGAIWVIGILDAWIDAHLYDVRIYTPENNVDGERESAVPETQRYLTLTIEF